MSQVHADAARVIDARPEDVYAVLSDYRVKHQQILSPEHFRDFVVEEGGQGAGTVIRFHLIAGGRERDYHMRVTEPEPGRVLLEKDTASSLVTTFTLTPLADGRQTNVRIATEWEGSGGIGGFFERTFAPGVLRRLYSDELNRLAVLLGNTHASAAGANH
ncbi:MAG TPA: SRPBCC family protein [Ktedonobacterales bacterium]